MALKLSVFTTMTEPGRRGDNWKDALDCYHGFADEVVVVDGHGKDSPDNIAFKNHVYSEWPQEFDWPLIGEQFQKGYEAATGDWVIHADLDFILHEKDFAQLRKALEANNSYPAMTLWKYQFILPDRYNLKSRLVVAVNKGKYGNRIRFDSGGDLCQPSLDGNYMSPDDVPEARVPFYNYEKLTKTEKQIIDDVERMDDAYLKHFGSTLYSTDELTAFEGWVEMMRGRFEKPQKRIELSEHPKFVQETIRNLKPEQWGYDGLGYLERNGYA
jgi:glycosyltransferase involved in cell wall biosynthesis